MGDDTKALIVAATAILSLALIVLLGSFAYLFFQFLEQREVFSDGQFVKDAAYEFSEELVEQGVSSLEPDLFDQLIERRVVVLTETINERSVRRVLRQLEVLEHADAEKPIDLLLATGGGWTDGSFAIVDRIRRLSAVVNAHAEGGCYSGCVVILAAATGTRSAGPSCLLSVHSNRSSSEEDYSWPSLDLRRFDDHFQNFTEIPANWYPLASDRSYYMNAQEALEFGIIDEIR